MKPRLLLLRTTRVVGTLLLIGGGATLGCGAGSANSTATVTAGETAAVDDEPTAGLLEHHRYHHHGGVTLFVAMSLDTLGVSPEQRAAVERIRLDLHARMEPARAAEQELVAALADGVAAGTVDTARVDAALARVTATAGAVHDASAEALNELHSLLSAPERAALVDKVEAHWAVWRSANAEDTAASRAGDRLATLAADLELSASQVDKIRAGQGEQVKTAPLDSQEIDAHLRAFGAAFEGEKFDAKTLTTANSANAHMVGWGAARMAHFVENVNPVLTPEQRTRFATMLREHGAHNPSAERPL
jgi:Heavy-metal resistance